MGLFDGDKKVAEAAAIARLETIVEHLTQENQYLREQVSKLQEALFAKESPVAYQHMKMDEAAANFDDGLTPEQRERRNKVAEVTKKWVQQLEAPLFEDADDMVSALSKQIGAPEPSSLHDNSES